MIETQMFTDPVAVSARLAEMRLTLDGMREVVLRGETARNQATNHDPVTAGAINAYQHRVRAMRDLFCVPAFGWIVRRDAGLEMIESEDGAMAIVTKSGTPDVGRADGSPQPKYDVGEVAERKVNAAHSSLTLDPNWLNAKPKAGHKKLGMYMLLVHRDGDVVQAEVSLAEAIENGEVTAWLERILLPDIDLRDPPPAVATIDDGASAIVDVPVSRKK